MTGKLRAIRRLCETRKKIRDVASEAAARSDMHHAAAESRHAEARNSLDELLETPVERFLSGSELIKFDAERVLHAHVVKQERARADKLKEESERAKKELREKTRELKTIEKALEREKKTLADRERSSEQRLSDDLSGTKSGKSAS
jgi:hypothetical protein